MKVLVAGSSGLIGTALCNKLAQEGHGVVRLVRRASETDGELLWDPEAGVLDGVALEGVEAVVTLGIDDMRAAADRKSTRLNSSH